MRIGVMARTLADGDGPGIANRNLLDRLIEADPSVDFVLFYSRREHLGRYGGRSNVREVVIPGTNKLVWDQVFVPLYAWREKIDVLFQPKFTVPLLTRRPVVTICRGTEYFRFPEFYEWHDLAYVRIAFPLYYRRAARVVTLSDFVRDDLRRYLRVPLEKMQTVYSGCHDAFRADLDSEAIDRARRRYALPDRFLLAVTKPYQGKKRYPRKNIDVIIGAFLDLVERYPGLKLVLAGSECQRYVASTFGDALAEDNRLVFPGWVPQEHMPALYRQAEALVFPSYSESFGLPLVEAMACGCPVITSTGGACPEVVGPAGLLVEPADRDGLTRAIMRVLDDGNLRERLVKTGLERVRAFRWEHAAAQILDILKDVRPGRSPLIVNPAA